MADPAPKWPAGDLRGLDEADLQPVLLCALCRSGAGGECHTPGCGLWMNRAPDIPVSEPWRD